MNKIITSYDLKWIGLVISLAILMVVFWIDLQVPPNEWLFTLKIFVVPLLSLVALLIGFGMQGIKDLFSKPVKPFKNFFGWFIIAIIVSMISGFLLAMIVDTPLQHNPGEEHLVQTLISLPFVLLFEEVISFFFLLVIANLIYRNTKNLLLAQTVGVVVSAIIFGLLHYSTYYSGSMIDTLAHVIFVQGLIRIFFNLAGLKSNSIVIPLLIHIAFDVYSFALGSFV